MTPEDHQWNISLVKDKNHLLNLTTEQAEEVYKFEEGKNIYSEKYFFSVWDEWDYELSAFKKILNPDQFVIFEQNIADVINNYQSMLILQDKESIKEIEFNKDAIRYYKEEFLPDT